MTSVRWLPTRALWGSGPHFARQTQVSTYRASTLDPDLPGYCSRISSFVEPSWRSTPRNRVVDQVVTWVDAPAIQRSEQSLGRNLYICLDNSSKRPEGSSGTSSLNDEREKPHVKYQLGMVRTPHPNPIPKHPLIIMGSVRLTPFADGTEAYIPGFSQHLFKIDGVYQERDLPQGTIVATFDPEVATYYVKSPVDGSWLHTRIHYDLRAFPHGADEQLDATSPDLVATPSVSADVMEFHQKKYTLPGLRGRPPSTDAAACLADFNRLIEDIGNAEPVTDGSAPAFSFMAHITKDSTLQHEKFSLRFEIPDLDRNAFKKQYNSRIQGSPLSREQLADMLANDIKERMASRLLWF
ncbi:uncharacterized protein BXZ73DRAFT_81865 [Epithele typhae]|uniref:uncharacterized protein n=1 Tax=Epithele typhae TaxID=378194 RepID=UPI00200819BF|nr:uncharacterized protein BXZ73DRAFT_81865 [Epithele typhae]KAH9913690.1 hypothetical protein BXZ73DRAFT_81865 [Epithele typhae]